LSFSSISFIAGSVRRRNASGSANAAPPRGYQRIRRKRAHHPNEAKPRTPATAALVVGLTITLAMATPADAAIFIRLTTTTVHRGGVLQLVGNADHMPLYGLPSARMPCARYGTCSGAPIHRGAAPKRPFVFLGYTRRVPSGAASAASAVRLPRAVLPGRYKVFVWCKSCGGSLLIAGRDSSGQTLRVLP
jgi:hypothetical protein